MNKARLATYDRITSEINATFTIYERIKEEIKAISKRRTAWEKKIGLHSGDYDKVLARRKFNKEIMDTVQKMPHVKAADYAMFESLCDYAISLGYSYWSDNKR